MNQDHRPTTCARCGNAVQPGDSFCGVCGATLARATPEDTQVIPQPVAASQAPLRSNRKPLLLAGVAGLLLLLLAGGGAMAFLGFEGEEIELGNGVRSVVPEEWAVAATSSSNSEVAWLVPEGYENQDLRDFGDSLQEDKARQEQADIVAGTGCKAVSPPPEPTTDVLVSSGSLAKGEATVDGRAATWDLDYIASGVPSPDPSSTSGYLGYFVILNLAVCLRDTDVSIRMTSVENADGGPDEVSGAPAQETREEVRDGLRRRYAANFGAVAELLGSVDTGGLLNGGRTDLGAMPSSLDGIEGDLTDPFGEASEEPGSTGQTYGANTAEEERGFSASPSATSDPSASPDASAPSFSEEKVLELFGREYDEAHRSEDWARTYSMLDEASQQGITEAEWAEAQRIVREAEGPSAPLESVSVEQNEEMSDAPATLTLTYEDGTTETMMAMIPMVVEDESDSGVPKRILFAQEIGELRLIASSGQSIEGIEAEVEEAAGDYYRAAGMEDWAYTYENLDEETRSGFTEEEWSQKNQWFADNGEVIYDIESVGRTGTSSEFWGVSLTLTYEDGTSSTRETFFVYENGEWKHRFGEEENDLFMPDATFEEFVEAQQ